MEYVSKRILFIAFDYHEYSRAIDAEFQVLGFDSHFNSIQPGKLLFKIARRLSPSVYRMMLDAYHRRIILSYDPDCFDRVVFLQVHQVSTANMNLLRKRQSRAQFTLYNWDAVTTHDYRPYLQFFDNAFTFDPDDAKALAIGYLPLFCIRRFQGLGRDGAQPLSAYFVGNIVNPARYTAVNTFAEFCQQQGIEFRQYLSTTLHGYTQMRRQGMRPKDVSFSSIADADFVAMVERSAAVFDFANHRQSGFTMRTMENLCAGKKIITNNPNVRLAEFYSEDRFLVFEGMDFSGVMPFLRRPLQDPENDFELYHVQSFAARLLGLRP